MNIQQICQNNNLRRFKRSNELNWSSISNSQIYLDDGQNKIKRELTMEDLKANDWVYEEVEISMKQSVLEQIWLERNWNKDESLPLTGNEILSQLIDSCGLNA